MPPERAGRYYYAEDGLITSGMSRRGEMGASLIGLFLAAFLFMVGSGIIKKRGEKGGKGKEKKGKKRRGGKGHHLPKT